MTTLETKVNDFLAQKRIAVAGVSRNDGHHPAANLICRRLKSTGHDVFPVNPKMTTFDGQKCYPDLQSIPGSVDGVVIITKPQITDQIVREAGAAGVRRVWMHESINKGSSVSTDAVEFCKQNGITVIAGACPMMFCGNVDFGHKCMRLALQVMGRLPQ